MLTKLRRRLTYTNVAVTVALFFALSGGAYAAKRYLITSTQQISPKVLKALHGAGGAPGATGAPGAAGAAGSQGPQGPPGTPGGPGKEGPGGPSGKNGENGKDGSPWTAGGVLPKGATEEGSWSVVHTAATAGEGASSPISFTIPLLTSLSSAHVHYLKVGEKGKGNTQGCPESSEASNPQAEPGNLCIFATVEENTKPFEIYGILAAGVDPETEAFGEAGRTGFIILLTAAVAGEEKTFGTWAVTAH
jgi:hypothetical protein